MIDIQKILPQLEPELLTEFEKEGIIKSFEPDEVIMRTGQFVKSTMLILDGLVKVYRENEDGGEFLMYYLQPGEACAISIICASKLESSQIMAKVMEPTTVLLLPIQLLDKWMSQYKSWYYFVLETYRNRFDELLTLVDNVAFRNMDERLVFFLKRHQTIIKSNNIELSHQQIAEELNTSREVISRLLKKMEQQGLLILNRNNIELLKL
jgi:CRP/FNR family transcriptional regulator